MHNRGLCVGKTVTSRQGNQVQAEQNRIKPKNPPRALLLNPFNIKVWPFVFPNLSRQDIYRLK